MRGRKVKRGGEEGGGGRSGGYKILNGKTGEERGGEVGWEGVAVAAEIVKYKEEEEEVLLLVVVMVRIQK